MRTVVCLAMLTTFMTGCAFERVEPKYESRATAAVDGGVDTGTALGAAVGVLRQRGYAVTDVVGGLRASRPGEGTNVHGVLPVQLSCSIEVRQRMAIVSVLCRAESAHLWSNDRAATPARVAAIGRARDDAHAVEAAILDELSRPQ